MNELLADGYRRNIDELREKMKALELQIDGLKAQVKKEHSDYLQEHHAHYSVELLRMEAEKKLADMTAIHTLVRGERDRLERDLKESNRLNGELKDALQHVVAELGRCSGKCRSTEHPKDCAFCYSELVLREKRVDPVQNCQHVWQDLGDSAKGFTKKCRNCDRLEV